MPIWRLIPVDSDDLCWQASSHRGPVLVRAPDEEAARAAAQAALGVKTRFPPGAGLAVPPWTRPALVRAERVKDAPYPLDGPVALLEPSFDADLRPSPPRKGSG